MAATDTLDNFVNSISTEEKERFKDLIALQRVQMFAARSEDARVRLVHDFIHEVHAVLDRQKK